jgi:hypothetical protein
MNFIFFCIIFRFVPRSIQSDLCLVIFALLLKVCHPLFHAVYDRFEEINFPLIWFNFKSSIIESAFILDVLIGKFFRIQLKLVAHLLHLTCECFKFATYFCEFLPDLKQFWFIRLRLIKLVQLIFEGRKIKTLNRFGNLPLLGLDAGPLLKQNLKLLLLLIGHAAPFSLFRGSCLLSL